MKTVDIKGKKYVEVNERVKEFHKLYPEGMITSEIISHDGGVIVIKSTVTPVAKHHRSFTGIAYEKEGSTFINKTSYVENCETSAVGRALGFLGIGIDTSIASKEEVETAIENQKKPQKKPVEKKAEPTEDDFIADQEELSKLPEKIQEIIDGMVNCKDIASLKSYVNMVPKESIEGHQEALNKYYEKRKVELK